MRTKHQINLTKFD